MNQWRRILPGTLIVALVVTLLARPSYGLISVGTLTKDQAKKKYGITMHCRTNGDRGLMVWLTFKREGWLEKFTYAEFIMEDDEGKHMISARLQPNPITQDQPKEVTTVAFSVEAKHLSRCGFLVVCYNSNEGDVGYYLNAKDFLDVKNPVTEK